MITRVINRNRQLDTLRLEAQNYYSSYGGPITALTYRINPTVPIHLLGFHSIEPLGIYSISSSQHIGSGGKGLSYNKAYISTVGEAIERISASFSSNELSQKLRPIHSKGRDLQKDGIPLLGPDKIFLFHDEQYKKPNFEFSRFTLESNITWVRGKVLNGGYIYAPAQVVLFLYVPFKNEDNIAYTSSNGLAVHEKFDIALTSAIIEYIERDAIQIGWYSKVFPYIITGDFEDILNFAEVYLEPSELFQLKTRYGVLISLWRTNLPVYVFSVILYLKHLNHHKYAIGFGASTNPVTALRRAIEEAFQVREGINSLAYLIELGIQKPSISPTAKKEDINTLIKTIEFYGYEKNFNELMGSFFLKGESLKLDAVFEIVGEEKKEKLSSIQKILEKMGISAVYFDLTPENIDSRIKTVKVFLPELTILGSNPNPFLGHPRFYNFPVDIGLLKKPLKYENLNKKPCPF